MERVHTADLTRSCAIKPVTKVHKTQALQAIHWAENQGEGGGRQVTHLHKQEGVGAVPGQSPAKQGDGGEGGAGQSPAKHDDGGTRRHLRGFIRAEAVKITQQLRQLHLLEQLQAAVHLKTCT